MNARNSYTYQLFEQCHGPVRQPMCTAGWSVRTNAVTFSAPTF